MNNIINLNEEEFELSIFRYKNMSKGILATSKETGLSLPLTLSLDEIKIDPSSNDVIIKDHSQNFGFVDQLINQGVLENQKIPRALGFNKCYICKLTKLWSIKLSK